MTHGRTNISVPYIKATKESLLYNYGDECTDISGGWTALQSFQNYRNGYTSKEADCLRAGDNSNNYGNGSWRINNLVDFTGYDKLCVQFSVYDTYLNDSSYACVVQLGIGSTIVATSSAVDAILSNDNFDLATARWETHVSGSTHDDLILEIDVSNIAEGCVYLYTSSGAWNPDTMMVDFYKVWLE